MARRAQCGIVIEVQVLHLIFLIAHRAIKKMGYQENQMRDLDLYGWAPERDSERELFVG